MVDNSNAEKARIRRLLNQVASREASDADCAALEKLMEKDAVLRDAYRHTQREFEADVLLQSCLRVLFKTASPGELQEVQNLKHTNPAKWRAFERLGLMLRVMGESARLKPDGSVEPTPSKVRKEFLESLKSDKTS